MFIGRERELDALNKLYKSNKFEFAVIYGRRRVGKTALINEFIDNKKAIYFMGVESNAKQNLENFSKSIMEFASGIETESSFLSFQAALEYVSARPLPAVLKYDGLAAGKGVVIAEVLHDNNIEGEGYETGEIMKLAPVAEISKTTHYLY